MLFKCYSSILTRLPPCMLQYYALQILETVIKTRWKILPRNQCEGKTFIYATVPLFYLCQCVFYFFCSLNVTCGCHVEEYSSSKHAGLLSARLACTGCCRKVGLCSVFLVETTKTSQHLFC